MAVLKEDTGKIMFKMLYVLKKMSDEWLFSSLCHDKLEGFSNAQLPLLFSITDEGISNSKLALKVNISKQAASKIIKELEEHELVHTEKCCTDARSGNIFLTDKGIRFREHVKTQIMDLEAQYIKVAGAKNYEIAMDVLQKMIDFHEQQLKVKFN